MADPDNSRPAIGEVPKRRRRRQQAPVEEVSTPSVASEPTEHRIEAPPLSRWQRWKREALSSLGLSPTFRVYVFVGSIVAILAFLLYNESLIRELREHEQSRVKLYAELISFAPLATNEQVATIFKEVIANPRVDFPIIITNHRGEVTFWRVEGLPAQKDSVRASEEVWRKLTFWSDEEVPVPSDTSATTMETLRRLIREMDAENPPIPYYVSFATLGLLRCDGANAIITDTQGEIVKWRGADLPSENDTTAAASIQVQTALRKMETAGQPLLFEVPAATFSYLHSDGDNAVITDNEGEVVAWQGTDLPAATDTTQAALVQVRSLMQEMGTDSEPLAFRIPSESFIHYGESELVSRVSLAPFVQIGALLLFLLVGYVGFRNIKRSEQRSIWVGMAKETAHQLGTPLSSLSGWLELIRQEVEEVPEAERQERLARIDQMTGEMQKDMQRLTQIASRFSQIGSVPELRMADVVAILAETIAYFKNRGPQFGRHQIRVECQDDVPPIPLNADLISWVFENLFKNAMDAMENEAGTVEIRVGLLPEHRAVQIAFQDDGRGIEPENISRIFEPGFSTKKRGWGLGLAFVKRIVEEYHRGRISVVQSAPGEGTTIEVVLPLRAEKRERQGQLER